MKKSEQYIAALSGAEQGSGGVLSLSLLNNSSIILLGIIIISLLGILITILG